MAPRSHGAIKGPLDAWSSTQTLFEHTITLDLCDHTIFLERDLNAFLSYNSVIFSWALSFHSCACCCNIVLLCAFLLTSLLWF
jgi:hypothetical protein